MPHPIRGFSLAEMLRPGWSEFGGWRAHGTHQGFDYYCPEGTPIYATGNGQITGKGGPTGDAGWQVTVQYDGYTTRNVHMRSSSPLAIGARVNSSSVIGYVGATGNATNIIWNGKRHLHHEVYVNGNTVDPLNFHGNLLGAGGGTIPIEPTPTLPRKESRPMYLIRTTDGTVGLVTDSGYVALGNPAHITLFERMFNAYPSFDTFNGTERNVILGYIRAASTVNTSETARILEAIAAIPAGGGTSPTAQEIADAVVAALPPSQGGTAPTAQAIALAVEQQLADNFALIPQAVNLDLKNRL